MFVCACDGISVKPCMYMVWVWGVDDGAALRRACMHV